jgi:hypothetical protein
VKRQAVAIQHLRKWKDEVPTVPFGNIKMPDVNIPKLGTGQLKIPPWDVAHI